MTRVFVWGAGRCGRTLANALSSAGHEVVGTWNRTAESAARGGEVAWPRFHGARPPAVDDAEVVWFTVTDAEIERAARRVLRPHHVALHASGAVPAQALRCGGGRAVAACHPLQSFASVMSPPDHVRGIAFGLEGDPEAVRAARALVDSVGAWAFEVADEVGKALYHAACCVASNAMVALADQAVTLFAAAGVPRPEALRALAPLIRGTAENLARAQEAVAVLTGPIARGDTAVVARHEAAIAERVPASLEDYRAVCRAIEAMLLRPE